MAQRVKLKMTFETDVMLYNPATASGPIKTMAKIGVYSRYRIQTTAKTF